MGADEDVLTYAMFPQVAPKFFRDSRRGPENLGKDPSKPATTAEAAASTAAVSGGHELDAMVNYVITLNGKEHRVSCCLRQNNAKL